MQAAAHTPGGFGGVPQSVGKEFTKGDEIPAGPTPLSTPEIAEDGLLDVTKKLNEKVVSDAATGLAAGIPVSYTHLTLPTKRIV